MTEPAGHDVYGIDFSGASDAGDSIYIAAGDVRDGSLVVSSVQSAAGAFDTTDRAPAHDAVREFVAAADADAVGFDFPFGLPREVVHADTWRAFAAGFADRFPDPTAFREACLDAAGGTQRRRETDDAHAALCPYGLRVHKQTFYGIRDVLAPLAANGHAVPPMVDGDAPAVLETYPAATLDHYALFRDGYKGGGDAAARKRARNFDGVERATALEFAARDDTRALVKGNAGGDALDAILAAYAAYRGAVCNDPVAFASDYDALEGCIYH